MSVNDATGQEKSHGLVIHEIAGENLVEVELSGKLTREDYEKFAPELEKIIEQHGTIRLLALMRDFHGWRLGALWQDIKFDLRLFKQMQSIALVGETKWQEWLCALCVPFTTGEIRYFHHDELESARGWLRNHPI